MSQDKNSNKIEEYIDSWASNNPQITKAEVKTAKQLYSNDTRPIEEIKAELMAYSELIKNGQPSNITEEVSDPVTEIESDPVTEIESDLQNLYSNKQTENIVEGKRGQVIYPGQSNQPTLDPTDELDSMFEKPSTEKDFAQVDELGERPKVFQLKFPSFDGEDGYSNMEVLLTIATLLSIMGIVISAFIIHFK